MNKKIKKQAIIFLALLFFVVIIGKTVRVVKGSVWDGGGHINIAIDNGDLEIWSIEPSKKTISDVFIPKDTMLLVSHYGSYKAASIGRLSLLERKNGSLVKEAIEETLAIPIDAVILPKEEKKEHFLLQDFFGLKAFTKIVTKNQTVASYVTNLSSYDIFRLWLLSFSLKEESIQKVDLGSSNTLTKTELPDGGVVLTINRDRFSKLAAVYFKDYMLEKENDTIEVLNGTDVQGKATSLSLLLTNIGGNVINTGKSEKPQSKSLLFTKEKNYTAKKIAQIVGGSFSDSPPKESRADILVLLGGM